MNDEEAESLYRSTRERLLRGEWIVRPELPQAWLVNLPGTPSSKWLGFAKRVQAAN